MAFSGCSKEASKEKKSEGTPSTLAAAVKAFVPDKAITLVVNMAPGGSADLLARTIEKIWPKYSPQPILIVNKPGAGGVEGATFVSRSKPDGYTLGLGYGGGSDLVMPQLQKMEYDPFKALTPKDKRVKPLAQSLDGRYPLMPDVPSLKEQGIPFSCIGTVKGISAPNGMPKEVMDYYNELFKKISQDEEFKKTMADMLQPVVYKNSDEFAKFFKQEYENFGKLIKDLGIEQK